MSEFFGSEQSIKNASEIEIKYLWEKTDQNIGELESYAGLAGESGLEGIVQHAGLVVVVDGVRLTTSTVRHSLQVRVSISSVTLNLE